LVGEEIKTTNGEALVEEIERHGKDCIADDTRKMKLRREDVWRNAFDKIVD
jgi:type IV secretory pathway ATPase VirB11/archaellum biosynthesis ATPase